MLEKILSKRGIKLRDERGELRNVVDVIEDMYLRMNLTELHRTFFEMSEEELTANIFDDARGRRYKGAE